MATWSCADISYYYLTWKSNQQILTMTLLEQGIHASEIWDSNTEDPSWHTIQALYQGLSDSDSSSPYRSKECAHSVQSRKCPNHFKELMFTWDQSLSTTTNQRKATWMHTQFRIYQTSLTHHSYHEPEVHAISMFPREECVRLYTGNSPKPIEMLWVLMLRGKRNKTYAIAMRPPRRSAPRVLSNAGNIGSAPAPGGIPVGDGDGELDILLLR
jgi:hypothetical protein